MSEQKIIKPKIEDSISEYLTGGKKKNALEFIGYLRENKMSPHWNSTNSWKSSYKQKLICFTRVYPDNSWMIRPALYNTSNPCDPDDFDKFILNEGLEEFIWENIKTCQNCLPCSPGISITIAGKEFHNRCGYHSVQINNPDVSAINITKRILEYKKNAIIKGE